MWTSVRPLVLASLVAATPVGLSAIPGWTNAVARHGRAGAQHGVCGDAQTLVSKICGAAAGRASDVRVRVINLAPPLPRQVVELRLRTKSVAGRLSALVETTHPVGAHLALLVNDRGAVRVYGEGNLDWLSPCMRAEDLLNSQYWWPTQHLLPPERIEGQEVCVVRSEPAESSATAYETVLSYIDPVRRIVLRAEKRARQGATLRFTYRGVRKHEGVWVARQMDVDLAPGGCHSQVTILGGTTNARLDDALFDPSRFAGKRPQ